MAAVANVLQTIELLSRFKILPGPSSRLEEVATGVAIFTLVLWGVSRFAKRQPELQCSESIKCHGEKLSPERKSFVWATVIGNFVVLVILSVLRHRT